MRVFIGPGISSWPLSGPKGLTWLHTTPVVGKPLYPIAIDLLESAAVLAKSPVLESVCRALAPTWEELETAGLTSSEVVSPSKDEIGGNDDAASLQSFYFSAIARGLGSVGTIGNGSGIIIRFGECLDKPNLAMLERLVLEPALASWTLAVEVSNDRAIRRLPRFLATGSFVECDQSNDDATDIPAISEGLKLLAVAVHGLPQSVFRSLGFTEDLRNSREGFGPSGREWVFLPPRLRRRILRMLPRSEVVRLHRQIFDITSPSGWGYIRRAGHAVEARCIGRLRAQHTRYLYGVALFAPDYLFRHLAALADLLEAGDGRINASVGAARLATRIWTRNGHQRSVKFLFRALRCLHDPLERAILLFELANLYAIQKRPEALTRARHYYSRGYAELSLVDQSDVKLRAEINYLNGLALIEYHEGHDAEALNLERRARGLVEQQLAKHPDVARWAKPLLNANTAKLLLKRFNDPRGARDLLEETIATASPQIAEFTSLSLAKIHFDSQDYVRVAELLAPVYNGKSPIDVDESEELFGRLLLTISLFVMDKREQAFAQLQKVEYLAGTGDRPYGVELAKKLKEAFRTPQLALGVSRPTS